MTSGYGQAHPDGDPTRFRSDEQWTHGGREGALDSVRASNLNVTVSDDPHVSIDRSHGDPRRGSLHIGLYGLHSATINASDQALAVIMLTIAAHLRAVGELTPSVVDAFAALGAMLTADEIVVDVVDVREQDLARGHAAREVRSPFRLDSVTVTDDPGAPGRIERIAGGRYGDQGAPDIEPECCSGPGACTCGSSS